MKIYFTKSIKSSRQQDIVPYKILEVHSITPLGVSLKECNNVYFLLNNYIREYLRNGLAQLTPEDSTELDILKRKEIKFL